MIRTFCLLAVGLALAVVALGGTTSCAGAPGSVGCPQVDVSFSNGDPPITVQNYSFESPACPGPSCTGGDGSTYTNYVTSWTGVGPEYGVFDPNTSQVNAGGSANGTDVPDGVQVAYLNPDNSSASLSQDVLTTVQVATTYTLTAYIGARLDGPPYPLPSTYGIALINGTNTAEVFDSNTACTAPTAGNFVNCTLSFDSFSNPSFNGDELGVELFASNNSGTFTQVLFDDVTLGFQSDSPEPGTIGLALLGLGALAVLRLRARRKSLIANSITQKPCRADLLVRPTS